MKNQNPHAPTPESAGRLSIMALAVAAALAAGAAQAQDGITNLGALGGTLAGAKGVSADGAVVVGYAATSGGYPLRAFRWTESGGMTDLGTLGGTTHSAAYGVSADGTVVVGEAAAINDVEIHAFRWTQAGGMIDLGTLGGDNSLALGASANGAVVAGGAQTTGDAAWHAFRWTQAGGMADLGTLGGTDSWANGVSADGAVVVGEAQTGNARWHAFRWTQAGMVDLGTLGGTSSYANGVSADGAVVVGGARTTGGAVHAFHWTQAGGMADLGALGGTQSTANGVSADGAVVVGAAYLSGDVLQRAFRWTQAGGMQSVEDWLRAAGVTVASDITYGANGTSGDGSVVVGVLTGGSAFIARVAGVGSGLVTLAELQQSLGAAASGGGMVLSAPGTVLNGAHSRPLARRVAAGQQTFWLAGDWGRDDHGPRSGDLGLAEVGFGQHLGPLQLNVSLGQTWAKQNLSLNGRAKSDGNYLVAEALLPVAGTLWATAGAYAHWGRTDLRRGYLNAGAPDASTGRPDAATWGLRARLDWENAYRLASADFSPYVDLTYSQAKLAAYTESGGGFPAQFNARKDKVSELRLGLAAEAPLAGATRLVGLAEAAHRFERNAARTSGQVLGLFGFDLAGPANKQDWLRAGVGIESTVGEGRGSLMLNATTQGEALSYWLAAGWQKTF